MQNTRQRILEYIDTHRLVSAVEMSRVFQLTAANIRHHISILTDLDLIEAGGQVPSQGRGRPTTLYMRTRKSQVNNLVGLLGALMAQFSGPRESKQRDKRLKKLAQTLLGSGEIIRGTITQRLFGAVDRLNELRYRARWEAHAESPRVILGQCPYAAIIDQHPELCQMDAHLIGGLLDIPVEQTIKFGRGIEDASFCAFVLVQK